MDQLLDFSDFNLGSLIGIIQKTLDWLNDLTDSDFMSYEIPFINKNLGELLDFASSFADKIQSRIDFERINTVQDFIEQFTNAGILPAGMNVVYDAVNRTLNLPVNFDFDFSDLNLRNLANLGDFSYEKLLDLATAHPTDIFNPTDTFDKDTILDGMLGMLRTPLRELGRWELIDSSFFSPSKTILHLGPGKPGPDPAGRSARHVDLADRPAELGCRQRQSPGPVRHGPALRR